MVMKNLPSFVVSVCLASISWNVVSANSCQSISDRISSRGSVYRHNGICYAFMNNELKWVEAEKSCKDMGADMVRIPDETTMQFLKTVMTDELKWRNNGVWIGLHNRNNDGWKWTTGDEQTYRYWIAGAPTKTFGLVSLENCAVMRRTYDWKWGDYFCNNRFYKYKYICQFHMPTTVASSTFRSTRTKTSPTSPNTGRARPPTTETIPTITQPSTRTSTHATTTTGTTTPDPALCNKFQFSCTNGQCLSRDTRCNGIYDCLDFSDEHHCSVCTGSTIKCKNTNRCINPSWVCDGTDDCGDNSDEENCGSTPSMPPTDIDTRSTRITTASASTTSPYCKDNEFRCGDGACIDTSWQCDGDGDCVDHSDEDNCKQCRAYEWSCLNGRQCILQHWKCDGEDDCIDGTDEYNCMSTTNIPPTMTTTTIQPTISSFSTPSILSTTESPYCKDNEFRCFDGACIDTSRQCDGYDDCVDHSDEDNCKQCGASEWSCLNGRQCILQHWKCDGEDDCFDGTDEYNCMLTTNIQPTMTTTTIQPNISSFSTPSIVSTPESACFKCKTTGLCISTEWVCDGDKDCDDNSDENNCDYYDLLQEILDEKNRIRQLLRMSKDELLEFIKGSKEAVDLSMLGVLATGTTEDALVSALMSLFANIYVV